MACYWGISLILFFLLCIQYGAYQKMSGLFLKISCFVLFIFMALRATSVGADTKHYSAIFEQIDGADWRNLFTMPLYGTDWTRMDFEPGYRLLNKLVGVVLDGGQAITVVNSLIIIGLLYLVIKRWSADPMLSIWIYLTLGTYQTEMNMSRNAIAILISYLAMKYVKKRRPVSYIAGVSVATTFHSSSILFFPVYWLANGIRLDRKRLRNIFIISIVIGIVFPVIRPYLYYIIPERFHEYLEENTIRFQSLILGLFHFCLVMGIFVLVDKDKRDTIFLKQSIGTWLFVLDILLFCIGFTLSSAARMAALFGPYLMIYIPNLLAEGISSKQRKMTAIAFVFLLCGIQYIMRMFINNIGLTIPYQFFWVQ